MTLGSVMNVALGGGTITTLAAQQFLPEFIAINANGVYWMNRGEQTPTVSNVSTVMRVPLAGGATTTIAQGQAITDIRSSPVADPDAGSVAMRNVAPGTRCRAAGRSGGDTTCRRAMYNAADGDDVVGRDQPWKAAKRERLRLRNEYVEVRETAGRGRGLFARRAFVTGEVVCTFSGRVLPTAEDAPVELRHYVVETKFDRVIVPEISEVGGHLANHSCRPSTTFAYSEREDTLFLEATRAIAAGDEITTFYNWLGFDNPPCLCGEEHCAGVIGFRWTRVGDDKWQIGEADVCNVLAVAAANRNATVKELVTRLCKTYPSTDEAVRLYRPVIVKAAESLPPEDGAWLLHLFKLGGRSAERP